MFFFAISNFIESWPFILCWNQVHVVDTVLRSGRMSSSHRPLALGARLLTTIGDCPWDTAVLLALRPAHR
jgi:hypothetical protein